MIKNRLHLLFIMGIFFIAPASLTSQDYLGRLAILLDKEEEPMNPEIRALAEFLDTSGVVKVSFIRAEDILRKYSTLQGFKFVWYLKNDTAGFSEQMNKPKFTKALLNYIENGGNLILANQAFEYLSVLGIESNPPETRLKEVKNEGYGRMLGMHAFREHPVFDGLNGGAYILKPIKDTAVLQTGYFDDRGPVEGKVVGVDWDYIFLREDKKIVTEYQYGKGKIFCSGGYMLYTMPNINRQHLEKYTLNILKYLAGKLNGGIYHWIPGPTHVLSFQPAIEKFDVPGSKPWTVPVAKLQMTNSFGEGDYWDLAGQRILVMGTDYSGIDEIWTHPFMSLRDYSVGIRFAGRDTIHWLKNAKPRVEARPDLFMRLYSLGPGRLKEYITAGVNEPVAVVHYEYSGKIPAELIIQFTSNFRVMWPYSEKVLGTLFWGTDDNTGALVIKDLSGDYQAIIGSNKKPKSGLIGQYEQITTSTGSIKPAPTDKFQVMGLMIFDLELQDQLDVAICASDEGEQVTYDYYKHALEDPESVYKSASGYTNDFFDHSLTITGPDKKFNDGLDWSGIAADKFFVHTPRLGSSLVAGYATSDKGWDGGQKVSGRPGYGWYFGRDGEWSAFALLDYGDFAKVRAILENFNKFQDLNGKIFHELSTSGFAHYDAADATPLYIILAGKYLRHTGDTAFIRKSWPNIKKALDFCFSTDTDKDHLIENTNVGHGWEEGGGLYGTHTTLYLASCWAEALKEAGYMARYSSHKEEVSGYTAEAAIVLKIINQEFWNPKGNFFFHGKYKNGSYLDESSITQAIPFYFKQADREKAGKVLKEFASNSFTSDWGCRIVGENSRMFNPNGYHTGSVWPLFTGWTALAEFKNGNYLQGYTHLMNNLLIYQYWGLGYIEEVLNGLKFQPSGVCHHQCWSETMVLQPAFEGMLGFEPDAMKDKLTLRPWFPQNWDYVEVKNIRAGNHEINMMMRRGEEEKQGIGEEGTEFNFRHDGDTTLIVHFAPVFPPGTVLHTVRINGQPAREPAFDTDEYGWKTADFEFRLDSLATIIIRHTGGICALPVVPEPRPGDESEGFRIISAIYNNGLYKLDLQAKNGASENLKIWTSDGSIGKIENGEIVAKRGNVLTVRVNFPDTGGKYSNTEVVVHPPE
jgi:hypothetical protein